MAIYEFDPLRDPRWPELLEQHPSASVFHTPSWLNALRDTYGYEPVGYTTSAAAAPLEDGVVFCRVKSWLTGRRLVSLPFSDHCQPLLSDPGRMIALLRDLAAIAGKRRGYVELRPRALSEAGSASVRSFGADEFSFHTLDLRPDAATLFRTFHKNSIRAPIRRAEREELTHEAGRSGPILEKFYRLLLLTRRRHRLPPQPVSWFRNVIDCLGESATIHLASKNTRPVAGILTLRYKKTLVYKYACSDAEFHNLGGMPFLFWKAIQEAKTLGLEEFDLGRSDLDNAGLVSFKEHLGATSSKLTYYRFPAPRSNRQKTSFLRDAAGQVIARLPEPALRFAGSILYKHAG